MHKAQVALIIAVALVLSFISGWSLQSLLNERERMETTEGITLENADSVMVTIDNGNGEFKEMPSVPYVPGDSVLTVLQVLEEVELVTISVSDLQPSVAAVDVALSQLAESPNEPGWHFWINDTYGTLAPETYKVKPGDHIHLVFTSTASE